MAGGHVGRRTTQHARMPAGGQELFETAAASRRQQKGPLIWDEQAPRSRTSTGCTARSYVMLGSRGEESVVYGALLSATSARHRTATQTPNLEMRRPVMQTHPWCHPMQGVGHGTMQAPLSPLLRPSTAAPMLRSSLTGSPPHTPSLQSRPFSALRLHAHPRARPGTAPCSLVVMGTTRGAHRPQAFPIAQDAAPSTGPPGNTHHASAIAGSGASMLREAAARHAPAIHSPLAATGVHAPFFPAGPSACSSSLSKAAAAPPPGLSISACGEPMLMTALPLSLPTYAPSVKRRAPGIRNASHAPAREDAVDVCLIAGRQGTSILRSPRVQCSAGRGRAGTPCAASPSRPAAPHCIVTYLTGAGGYRFGSC